MAPAMIAATAAVPSAREHEAATLWPEESVRCWRGARCLGAKEVEVEVEVETETQQRVYARAQEKSRENSNSNAAHHHHAATAGYAWQEVEGVGGVMKGKRRVKVGIGGRVMSWASSRPEGLGLGLSLSGSGSESAERRQRDGTARDPVEEEKESRSWCGWCERVVLGRKDEMMLMMEELRT